MRITSQHLAFASIFVLLGLFLTHSWHGPDIWYHLHWAKQLFEHGEIIPTSRPLVEQPIPANGYWLFQSLVYLTYIIGGVWGASAVFILLWFGIAVLWLKLSRVFDAFWGALAFLAFVILAQLRFEQRPEVFTYFFLLLQIWIMDRATREKRDLVPTFVSLILLQIVWVNCHGYFVLGLLSTAIFAVSQFPEDRRWLSLPFKLLIASLINPGGFYIWENVRLYALVGPALRDVNQELFMPQLWPLNWPIGLFWLAWLVILIASVISLKRRQWAAGGLALLGLVLSLQAVRNMPFLVLLAPLALRELGSFKIQLHWPQKIVAGSAVLAAAFLSMLTVQSHYHMLVGTLSRFGIRLEEASYPTRAVDFLRSNQFKGKLFTDSYDGGFAEFHLPSVQVAGDSYFSDGPATLEFFAAIKDPARFLAFHQQHQFDGWLLNVENTDVMIAALGMEDFVHVYSDTHRALFVRRNLANSVTREFRYYNGEDLRDGTYGFGPLAWMAVARARRDIDLATQVLRDLETAQRIPAQILRLALDLSQMTQNQGLADRALALRSRAIE